jgi:hypothetical protein
MAVARTTNGSKMKTNKDCGSTIPTSCARLAHNKPCLPSTTAPKPGGSALPPPSGWPKYDGTGNCERRWRPSVNRQRLRRVAAAVPRRLRRDRCHHRPHLCRCGVTARLAVVKPCQRVISLGGAE